MSVFRYSFEALLATELDGETIIPKISGVELDIQLSGNAIVDQLGLKDDQVIFDVMLLNALAVAFWLLGGVSLWLKYRLLPSLQHIMPVSAPLPSRSRLFYSGIIVPMQR